MTFLGNNNILIFGGQTALGATSNQLFNLNFDVSDWQPVIPLSNVQPPGLTYHSAGFSNTTNELIVFGGVLSNNTVSKDLWVFSLTSKTWSLHQASGPGARTNQASAMIGDNMYVFGGQDASFTVHADLWKLNIPTRVWTQLA
ncbi:Negative regulator of mitotic exit, partial [Rhizoclosmatium hyalinum]